MHMTKQKARRHRCAGRIKPQASLKTLKKPASPSWRWIAFLLAVLFNILTISYASNPGCFSWHVGIGGSPARAVLFLSIFSQVTNIMLSATLGHSNDIIRDSLAARENGHNLAENQLLQTGTGVEALVKTLFMLRGPTVWCRLWSIFRLLCMIVVPALGIIIFSDVNTSLVFTPNKSAIPKHGYGVGDFNSSLAAILQPITDLTFSTRFKDIFSDSDRSIEITKASDRARCSRATSVSPTNGCHSTYYLPGGIENYAPILLADERLYNTGTSQPLLALNQNGFYFEFSDGDLGHNYNGTTDCLVSGFAIGAFQLCMQNTAPNQLHTSIIICPEALGSNGSCLTDYSWHSPNRSDWAISLTMFQRHADIAYNGLNGTIMSHNFVDSQTALNISSTDLLGVFNTTLSPIKSNPNTAFLTYLDLLGLGNNKPVLPLTIWQYFESLKKLNVTDPLTTRRAITGLQSLVTIPIYHCQPKDFAELRKLLSGLSNSSDNSYVKNIGPAIVELFPVADANVEIYPAFQRYNLQIGPHSLLVYMVLSNFTLLLCFIAQLMGSFTGPGRKAQKMSPYPTRNMVVNCQVRDRQSNAVSHEVFERTLSESSEREKLEYMAKLRIFLINCD